MRSERRVVTYLAFLSVILAFGVDTALPAFDELRDEFDLGRGSGEVSLVVTYYLLGMAAGQMVWGTVSDRWGRRVPILVGLTLYGTAAVGAGLAQSMPTLLAARFVWGLGAASPSVLRPAIARDLYSGNQMARVISFMMAVFLIGPAVAPSIGDGILRLGGWRLVFYASAPLAVIGMAWTVRFGETLPAERRRPLDLRATGRGIRAVVRTRATIGYTMLSMFTFGAFFIYLGSSQPIIDEIYGYGQWFALIFGAVSIFIAAAVLTGERLIRRVGAAQVCLVAMITLVGWAAAFTVVTAVTGGVPRFGVWFGGVTVYGALTTVITPTASALAMQPMERVAGTASGVYGVITLGGGAALANVFDRMIEDTVTPMAVGFLVYASVALLLLLWARGGTLEVVDPDTR